MDRELKLTAEQAAKLIGVDRAVTVGTPPPPLTIVQVPIGDLRPDPFNPRRISDDELNALTAASSSSASSIRSSPGART